MDFLLTEDERMIRDAARELATKEFAPKAAHYDETSEFPHDNVKKLAELGFMGMMRGGEMGRGGARPPSPMCWPWRRSPRPAPPPASSCPSTTRWCAIPSPSSATTSRRSGILKPLASGQKIGAYCLTEPEAGSDAPNHPTPRGEGRGPLRGQRRAKNFITNGQVADTFVVYVKTDPEAGHAGSARSWWRATPGARRGARRRTPWGSAASSTCSLSFDDVKVPAANLLGKEGEGFKIALTPSTAGGSGSPPRRWGSPQAALDAASAYAQERNHLRQAHRRAAGHPVDARRLGDRDGGGAAPDLQGGGDEGHRRALLDGGGHGQARPRRGRRSTIADRAVQIHGGYGYVKEYAVERFYRDAKITEIYEGTSEIQRLVVARSVLTSQAPGREIRNSRPSWTSSLPKKNRMLRDTIREFARGELAPMVMEYEREARFPGEVVKRLWEELGLGGMLCPEEYGGIALPPVAYTLVIEELARVWPALSIIVSVHNSVGVGLIAEHGTEEQKQKYPAQAHQRGAGRRVQPVRARRGQRRGGAAGHRRPRRRPLRAERREELGHQRRATPT